MAIWTMPGGGGRASALSRPVPEDQAEAARWSQSMTRANVLAEQWDQDLYDWMEAYHLDAERLSVLGAPDTSVNALAQSCQLQAVTYHALPTPSGPEQVLTAADVAGHWRRMAYVQYLLLGLREVLIVPYVDRHGVPRERLVMPYNVLAWSEPDAPGVPVALWELRERMIGGEAVYAWDQYSIADDDMPTMQVVIPGQAGRPGDDVTEYPEVYGGPMSGDEYPYRLLDGTPYLPHAWYHARETGQMWDAYAGRTVLRGTLSAAMLSTMALRAARDLQGNVILGENVDFGRLATRQAGTQGAAGVIPMEPGSMHEIAPKDPSRPTQITVVAPGADMVALRQAALETETQALYRAGIKPPSPTAQHGDARSGYAIALDDRSRREVARSLEPQMRAGDQQVLALWARILNRESASAHPEQPEDYAIQYAPIPLSPEEEREHRERLTWEVASGVKEPWELVREYLPGITEEEARRRASSVDVATLVASVAGSAGQAGRESPIPRNP